MMKSNDMDFFHQATTTICGSLDIHTVLNRCRDFLKDFMPLDGILMNIYDPKSHKHEAIAMTEPLPFDPDKMALSEEAKQFIEAQKVKETGNYQPSGKSHYRSARLECPGAKRDLPIGPQLGH